MIIVFGIVNVFIGIDWWFEDVLRIKGRRFKNRWVEDGGYYKNLMYVSFLW